MYRTLQNIKTRLRKESFFAFAGFFRILFFLVLFCTCGSHAITLAGKEDPWDDPVLEAGIQKRIERYRKGDARLILRGSTGNVLQLLPVHIKLKRHHFEFGIGMTAFCTGYNINKEETNKPYGFFHLTGEPAVLDRHERLLARVFNHGTVPLYWQLGEPESGRYDLKPMFSALRMSDRFGWSLEAHPLYWPVWLDIPAHGGDRKARLAYWKVLAKEHRGSIKLWNVINESLRAWRDRPKHLDKEVEWAFREADKIFGPEVKLSINELYPIAHELPEKGSPNDYYRLIERMLKRKLRIDAIGIQFHSGLIHDPKKLLRVYESFSKLNCPLYISEVSLGDACEQRPIVARNLYRLWFSVPRIFSITWWNWRRTTPLNYVKRCLINREWKPLDGTYAVLDKLINSEWHTELSGKSDAKGSFAFRGFYGSYSIVVERKGVKHNLEFELTPGGKKEIELIVP